MKRVITSLLICAMLFTTVLAGCGGSSAPIQPGSPSAPQGGGQSQSDDPLQPPAVEPKDPSQIKIFVEHFKNNSAVNMQWRYGALKAARELGVQVDVDASDDGAIEKNIALNEQAIAQGYNGIACIAATADSYIPIIEDAKAKGIPMATFHQDSPDSARLAFFGPDHVANARAEARFMADYLNKQGEVITIQGAASDAESLVVDSFIDELKSYAPEMKVVAVLSDTLDAAKAYEKISAAIEANPNVVGFFGATQRAGSDVATICTELGKDFSKLCIITNDVVPANIKLLQEGKITAINDQGALDTGYLAVKALYEYLTTGELTTYKYGLNYLPTNIVTTDTVGQYLEASKAIEDMLAAAQQK